MYDKTCVLIIILVMMCWFSLSSYSEHTHVTRSWKRRQQLIRHVGSQMWDHKVSYCRLIQSKGLPQQAEVAQGVPGSLRPRIFLTSRLYKGGRSSAIRTGSLYPRRNPWYSFSKAESTSGHMVLSGEPRKKSLVQPPGIDPGTVRLVASALTTTLPQAHCRLILI